MATRSSRCANCGKAGARSPSCPKCMEAKYCTTACLQSDAEKHKMVCSRCKSCGEWKSLENSSKLFCDECVKKAIGIPFLDPPVGWCRGGGYVATRWRTVGQPETLSELRVLSDSEDSDDDEYEERDTTVAPSVSQFPVITKIEISKPPELAAKVKEFSKDLRTGQKGARHQDERIEKLRSTAGDMLHKIDEYLVDTTTLLESLRPLIVDAVRLEDSKISSAASKLRDRCAGDGYMAYLEKLANDAQNEKDAKQNELKLLEANRALARTAEEVRGKKKESEEQEKTKTKLASELKQMQAAISKLEEQIANEEAKAKKEIAGLKSCLETVKSSAKEKKTLEGEKTKLNEQVSALSAKMSETALTENQLRHLIEKMEYELKLLKSAEGSTKQQAHEEECCPICMDRETNTLMIPCTHMYCLQCVRDSIEMLHKKSGRGDNDPYRFDVCVTCRQRPKAFVATNEREIIVDVSIDKDGVIKVNSGSLF